MKRYDTLSFQLELPFEPPVGTCPSCNPSGDPSVDMFRSMCPRHWREYNASFDEDGFRKDMKKSLEESFRHTGTTYVLNNIPGWFKTCA